MKLCHYNADTPFGIVRRFGFLIDEGVVDYNLVWRRKLEIDGRYNFEERADHHYPSLLSLNLKLLSDPLQTFQETMEHYQFLNDKGLAYGILQEDYQLGIPLDRINTYRDFYAHEKHVAKGFEKRNEPIPDAWYEIPAYYKGATAGFIGPEEEILWPTYSDKLDYELEMAVIIAREGRNIEEGEAIDHVLGFTILNDISARDIQKKEMSIRLGPSKGKDFCSIIGPVITTIDEFDFKEPDLNMKARINGEQWSEGQSGDSHFSFAQMIEFASKDEWILPGDLMGSGTVGTGCGLEIDKWIQPGDEIELEIEDIGILKNRVGKKYE